MFEQWPHPFELGDFAARGMGHLFENEEMLRAQLAGGLASDVRARRKAGRSEQLKRVVEGAATEAGQGRLVSALLLSMIRAETGLFLKDKQELRRFAGKLASIVSKREDASGCTDLDIREQVMPLVAALLQRKLRKQRQADIRKFASEVSPSIDTE